MNFTYIIVYAFIRGLMQAQLVVTPDSEVGDTPVVILRVARRP
jgi:hypothetical protein